MGDSTFRDNISNRSNINIIVKKSVNNSPVKIFSNASSSTNSLKIQRNPIMFSSFKRKNPNQEIAITNVQKESLISGFMNSANGQQHVTAKRWSIPVNRIYMKKNPYKKPVIVNSSNLKNFDVKNDDPIIEKTEKNSLVIKKQFTKLKDKTIDYSYSNRNSSDDKKNAQSRAFGPIPSENSNINKKMNSINQVIPATNLVPSISNDTIKDSYQEQVKEESEDKESNLSEEEIEEKQSYKSEEELEEKQSNESDEESHVENEEEREEAIDMNHTGHSQEGGMEKAQSHDEDEEIEDNIASIDQHEENTDKNSNSNNSDDDSPISEDTSKNS